MAAPDTPMAGKGPRPKMSTGSRIRLMTAPMPWMIMGPTALPVAWSTRSAANCMQTPRENTVTMVRYCAPYSTTRGSLLKKPTKLEPRVRPNRRKATQVSR